MAVMCALLSVLGSKGSLRRPASAEDSENQSTLRCDDACPEAGRVLSKPMSEHKITLTWQRGDKPFEYQKYSRDHTWKFDGGHEMQASANPAYLGNPKLVDPEEAFVASLSSCHMLTYLYLAGRKGFEISSYEDEAVGMMTKNERGFGTS